MIVAEETLIWFIFAGYVILLVVMYMVGFSDGEKAEQRKAAKAAKLLEKSEE